MSAVLAVVLMVLKIIGMILLALLLLLLLALLLPAGIHFRWSHIGGLRLQLCYGPLHFTLYPRKADEEEKRQNRRQKQSRGTRPKPSRLPPHRPSQPRRLQKRNCPHNLQRKSRRNLRKQSPQKRRKNPKKQNRPRPLKRNRENQKHRKHPRSRNRQYQNQKPNLPRPANREPPLPMPRQRKHLPRNHSRKKIPALWTASKRQSGRTLLAMCGTCSACCAPVWGRCCAASASAS